MAQINPKEELDIAELKKVQQQINDILNTKQTEENEFLHQKRLEESAKLSRDFEKKYLDEGISQRVKVALFTYAESMIMLSENLPDDFDGALEIEYEGLAEMVNNAYRDGQKSSFM